MAAPIYYGHLTRGELYCVHAAVVYSRVFVFACAVQARRSDVAGIIRPRRC